MGADMTFVCGRVADQDAEHQAPPGGRVEAMPSDCTPTFEQRSSTCMMRSYCTTRSPRMITGVVGSDAMMDCSWDCNWVIDIGTASRLTVPSSWTEMILVLGALSALLEEAV